MTEIDFLYLIVLFLSVFGAYMYGYYEGGINGAEEAFEKAKDIIDSYKKAKDESLQKAFKEHWEENVNTRDN